MSKDWRYGLGVVTIVGVLGVTAYSIYLWRKQQKEEENEITLEEAKEIVKENQDDISEEVIQPVVKEDPKMFIERVAKIRAMTEKDVDEAFEQAEDEIRIARPIEEVIKEQELEDEQAVEEELRAEQEMYEAEPEPILLEDEGEGKLRYDPNSDEALEQFMRMELADWHPSHSIYRTLERLYGVDFVPYNDGDHHLWSNLSDHRAEFFGPASRWTQRVSFADLVLHYAKRADFNLGDTAKYWAQELIEVNELEKITDMDSLRQVISQMNQHVFFNESTNTHGFFALSAKSVMDIQHRAEVSIDGQVTYEMEFNEFLKQFN